MRFLLNKGLCASLIIAPFLFACSSEGTTAATSAYSTSTQADGTGTAIPGQGDTFQQDNDGGLTDNGQPRGEDTNAPTPEATEESVESIVLDAAAHNAGTGVTAMLSFELPDDVVSFAITAEGTPGVYYVVDSLKDPDGSYLVLHEWYGLSAPTMCLLCVNRVASAESAHGALFPNTPNVQVKGGKYTFRLYGFKRTGTLFSPKFEGAQGVVQAKVVFKRSKQGPPSDGLIDLNFHFTGAGGITAENAATNPRFTVALATFEALYKTIGVQLGNLSYQNISEEFQVIDGFNGPDNAFEAAAKLTKDNPPGVNVIFVRELMDSSNPLSSFGVILGIAGGIPGPTYGQGTGRSAVFISTTIQSSGSGGAQEDYMGLTMAHEVGHYLGLFHTSELGFGTQSLHDHLPDTAENDAGNLMYYDSTGGGKVFTEGQGFVVRNNPWIRFVDDNNLGTR